MLYFFKPGDKVQIRTDLETGKQYGNVILTQAMARFCLGEKDEINYQVKDGIFKGAWSLERMPFFWSEEMLELVEDVKE